MITSLCWIPKGASKIIPEVAEPAEPPSKEEIEEMLNTGALERSGDSEEEEGMDVDNPKNADEVAHALAAAAALGGGQNSRSAGFQDITNGLQELDMDHYDDEDKGIELFSTGLGDRYYPSNDMDPYLKNKDDVEAEDDDEEENEDMTIKPTDTLIVYTRNVDELFFQLEVVVFEESEDGDSNMYVHHEVIIPASPLCLAWLDCNLKGGDKGSFVAVGSMDPAIEIWDVDLIGEVQPLMVLGGVSEKKKQKGKKTKKNFKEESHKDSVLGLAWNKEVRNVLASASADKTVKVWDMVTGKCAVTFDHHSDKVQAVAWNRHAAEILLSGSFDQSVVMMDMKSTGHACSKWSVAADVESLDWDPHNDYSFVVSLENGMVQGFDKRAASSNSDSVSKPTFTLHAHEKPITSISFCPSAPNLLATCSIDKTVKLWDLSNNQPSCVASQNPKAGAVFSVSFSEDSPFLLAIGGSKGVLQVWDTLSEPAVVDRFGKYSSGRIDPSSAD